MRIRQVIGKLAYRLMLRGFFKTTGEAAKALWAEFKESGIDKLEALVFAMPYPATFRELVRGLLGLRLKDKLTKAFEGFINAFASPFYREAERGILFTL